MDREQNVIEFIRRKARNVVEIRRIMLFGSRARGDASERSDFDFAVYADPMTDEAWARFCLEVEDEAPTLCGIDLVLASEDTPPDLQREIERGRIVYDGERS